MKRGNYVFRRKNLCSCLTTQTQFIGVVSNLCCTVLKLFSTQVFHSFLGKEKIVEICSVVIVHLFNMNHKEINLILRCSFNLCLKAFL